MGFGDQAWSGSLFLCLLLEVRVVGGKGFSQVLLPPTLVTDSGIEWPILGTPRSYFLFPVLLSWLLRFSFSLVYKFSV